MTPANPAGTFASVMTSMMGVFGTAALNRPPEPLPAPTLQAAAAAAAAPPSGTYSAPTQYHGLPTNDVPLD